MMHAAEHADQHAYVHRTFVGQPARCFPAAPGRTTDPHACQMHGAARAGGPKPEGRLLGNRLARGALAREEAHIRGPIRLQEHTTARPPSARGWASTSGTPR